MFSTRDQRQRLLKKLVRFRLWISLNCQSSILAPPHKLGYEKLFSTERWESNILSISNFIMIDSIHIHLYVWRFAGLPFCFHGEMLGDIYCPRRAFKWVPDRKEDWKISILKCQCNEYMGIRDNKMLKPEGGVLRRGESELWGQD